MVGVEGMVIVTVTMQRVFEELVAMRVDPYCWAREEQARGRKAVGITPMHFPEELIYASGALPVILQESNFMVTTGWDYLPAHFCAFTRSNVDAAVKGELDFLDAYLLSDFCLQMRSAFHIIERHCKAPMIYMWWPPEYNYVRGLASARMRIAKVRVRLEEITGQAITDESLARSIRIYNENRRLLREIDELRVTKPGVISVSDMQLLVQSSMLMDKERHNAILARVLEDLKEATVSQQGAARFFLSGHLCHAVRPTTLDLIEEVGGVVVGDDLYTGKRYYATYVSEEDPPIDALIHRWFDPGVACPEKVGSERNWMEELVSDVRRTNAEGVICLMPKHCEPHMFYYPSLRQRMSDENIPMLLIQTEHEMLGIEGVKTRIEAMTETLKGVRA